MIGVPEPESGPHVAAFGLFQVLLFLRLVPGLSRFSRLSACLEAIEHRFQRHAAGTLEVLGRRAVEPDLIFHAGFQLDGHNTGLAPVSPERTLAIRDGGELRAVAAPGEACA